MKVFPIKSPLAGEQVVSVHPEIKVFPDNDWRKRLNYYPGRALTHTALRAEQNSRSGRIATLGQMLSPGVIYGLEADQQRPGVDTEAEQAIIHISAGSAIAASGEVITLTRPLQARIKDIQVYAPATVLDGKVISESSDDNDTTEASGSDLSGILARRLGPTLQQVIDAGRVIPSAAILVLQPVQVEMQMQQDDDPCELDSTNYAYENWQVVDGARLVLYSWPEEILTMPVLGAAWRNRLANEVFTLEQHLFPDEYLPWMDVGVPIALIGFDDAWEPLFVDRHSVVRSGGKRRRSTSLVPGVGNRFLWQARFEQFNENLADVVANLGIDDAITQSATTFRYCPPIGVLPKSFVNFNDRSQLEHSFFPLSYHVEISVIPYEQLDVIVQDSAALASFDFNSPDRIQIQLPVPQIYYEADLLKVELIDAEFDTTIERFTDSRNNWLGRRLEIRRKASTVNKEIKGERLEFSLPDPDALDNAELAVPFENAIIEFGDSWRYLKGTAEPSVNWNQAGFNDAGWLSGATGIGYGAVENLTLLEDMPGSYVSIFLRKKFTLTELDQATNYKLVIVTSGGFSVYLNGQEIIQKNLSSKQFNMLADAEIELVAEEFNIEALVSGTGARILQAGENILAVQVHNHEELSINFSFIPRLIEKKYVGDIENEDYSTTIKVNDNSQPVLDNFEPVYETAAFAELKQYIADKSFLSTQEKSKLEEVGIEQYIDFLQEKVDKANDKVDFGFLRLQTNIYRVRQFMLGNVEASRLATSPILASIAKGETAVATKEEITKVVSLLKAQQPAVLNTEIPRSPAISARVTRGVRVNTDLFISGDLSEKTSVIKTKANTISGISSGVFIDQIGSGKVDFSSDNAKAALAKDTESSGVFLGSITSVPLDIEEQSFIVGKIQTFNNATVGERLQQPQSVETKNAGLASKAEALQGFLGFEIFVDDLQVPGFKDANGNDISKTFAEINAGTITEILRGDHDPSTEDDESAQVNAGVKAMENTTAFLRLIEGRIKSYKVTISKCKSTVVELRKILGRMDTRLKIIADELAETRHDVSVSRALKAEEVERLAGINTRRNAILEEHVPFLLFRRPRLSDVLLNTPVHTLHPDLSEAPLPVCEVDEDATPEEISAMIDVIREAPLKWFVFSKKILRRINRLNDLRVLIKSAKLRAKTKTTRHRLLNIQYDGLNRLARGINKTLLASHTSVSLIRRQTALIDLARFDRFGWNETRERANEIISLGDIIDGNHGRTGASNRAVQELNQIERVANCLYIHFTEVLPSIRLDWAERLSQFDAPVNLRNLYSLPRWGEIEYIERKEIQRLVDWLYLRIVTVHTDASNMISDLIRICILLASHAPVNQIISGLIPEATTVRVGSKINIIADLSRVRIGMNIAMISGLKTVARGRVVDIVGGQLTTQIVSTVTPSVAVEKNAKVQIGEPRSFGGIAYQQNNFLFFK